MPDFYGHPIGILESTHLRLEYLVNDGPRIVRLCLVNSEQNLLGEFPDIGWDTPHGYYQLFGGHRLLAAPEVIGVSYLPDASGLVMQEAGLGVELCWEPVAGQGLAKSIEVSLAADRPAVQIVHKIINRFEKPVRVAPWGVTAFPLGGTAYLPSPPSQHGLQPDRGLAIWPYAHWDDPRLKFSAAGIMISAEAGLPPLKVGTFIAQGCCAYLRENILFVKRFEARQGEYPDRGCNVEVYCSDRLIELETIAPLSDLMHGQSVTLAETWEVHAGEPGERKLQELFSDGGHS